MKRWLFLSLTLSLLLLSACAEKAPATAQPVPSAAPVLAVDIPAPEAEPAPDLPTESPQPVLEPGPEVLLFGTSSQTLLSEGGTLLADAELFALGGQLTLQQTEDALILSRLDEQLRLPLDGEAAHIQDGTRYLDAQQTAAHFGLVQGQAQDGTVWFAREVVLGPITENVNVPVLMYHAVGDETWGYSDLFIRPSELENHLKYLTENGYETIFFEDLSHLEDFEKPVLLTFDDGYDDNYTLLYPLLQKYQAKATIFVIPRDFGVAHKMTAEQAQELAASGLVSIQSHTWSHGNLATMDEQTLIFEMERSRDAIAALTGEVPYVVCYPEGHYSDLSIEVARRYYSYGLLMNGSTWNTSEDPFYVQRMYIPRGKFSIAWNVTKAGTSDAWR